jgi:hypothetical protein
VIARLDGGHVAADRLDDAGTFVPEHDRQRVGQRTLHHLKISVA